MVIDTFRGQYNFLSNFYPCRIPTKEFTYPSAEHAYQAYKTLNPLMRAMICNMSNPAAAKKAGRRVVMRPDWDNIKLITMLDILRIKFSTHPDLREKLLATGDTQLVEGNWWKDTFWGVYNGVGENYLGQLLMHVRIEIREGLSYDEIITLT